MKFKFKSLPILLVLVLCDSVEIANAAVLSVAALDTPVVQAFSGNIDNATNDPAYLRGNLAGNAATFTTAAGIASAMNGTSTTSTANAGTLTRIGDTGFINGSNVDFIRNGNRLENNPEGRAANFLQVTAQNNTGSTANQATVGFDLSIISRGGTPGTSNHTELLGFEGFYSVNAGASWTSIPGLGGEALGNHSATFSIGPLLNGSTLLVRIVDDNGSGGSSYDVNNTKVGEGAYGLDNVAITLSAVQVPEPTSLALVGMSVLGFLTSRRRA
jgi:hypothetical protein